MAVERDRDWDFHLRSFSLIANDPASDPSVLQHVRKLYEICKAEKSEDLVARVYPQLNKLFQRSVASSSHSQTSYGLLLLAILQFFLDFGEVVLHDADPSLRTFFRSCLSREFADPIVAEATLDFLKVNITKIIISFPTLLPQFFPLLLKLIAWNGEKLEKSFLKIFPGMMSPGSFLPLFPSIVDLPILVVALEKVERSSGSLIGSSIASIQKSTAPEMLLALMDEAYTGSTIEDREGDSDAEDSSTIDVADSLFLDLLKDENDGLVERQWTSPGMSAALQAAVSTPQTDRLSQTLRMTPRFLDMYFAIAFRDVNKSLICALIPLLMSRNATIFTDKFFAYEVRRRLLEFMLATFQWFPDFIALLKKPIMDRLGEAYDSPAKTELALQLCWAIGEHGGGGGNHKNAARELFESLELLLYENLSSRLVARSRNLGTRVWRRACDYLGLMNEPAICISTLGPAGGPEGVPGTVNWSSGGSKMIAHIPFYILSEQEGPPFHNFSFSEVLQSGGNKVRAYPSEFMSHCHALPQSALQRIVWKPGALRR
ncbi:hypothetical protein IFM89_020606 [Coptis chinensis]|uniref:AP-5 complex subunit zeta-1 n=1 Tax=Coptis chinensis TaxID=261450 RepID=A0A835I3Z1_9MAGN|nr:hypothetical protein IFM89_020606 [Coptis chinensis]